MVVHAGEYDKPVRKRAKGKQEGREKNSTPPKGRRELSQEAKG